ncbi:MAG: hypothetical protein EBZ48_17795 [Proteobacteria bacterium]|nr:hypothetical protein [Pseudomonadota bacterium]
MSQLDYGLIGNCQASALVAQNGEIVWCCLPRFDAPSVFASLVDTPEAGVWAIEPYVEEGAPRWETRQQYLRNTNVLSTHFSSPGGEAQFEIIDFMPRFPTGESYYRPPHLVRVVRPIRGIPRIRVRLRPRFEYGREIPKIVPLSAGIHYQGHQRSLFLRTDVSVERVIQESPFELKESRHFVLSYGEKPLVLDFPVTAQCGLHYWIISFD